MSESDVVRVELIKEELRTLVEEVGRAKKNRLGGVGYRIAATITSKNSWRTFRLGFTGGEAATCLTSTHLSCRKSLAIGPFPVLDIRFMV